VKLKSLHLSNYRNFKSKDFEFDGDISLILGNNGIGKTNILEAISLLSPGKGIRNSRPEEITKYSENNWNVSALCYGKLGTAKLDLTYSAEDHKKKVSFNDSKITHSELANFISVIWLTPQMDGIFLGPPNDRRKFLDRMVFSKIPNHASLVSKYEKLTRERMKILEDNGSDSWAEIIEKEMAILGISITKNRIEIIDVINKDIEKIDPIFPHANLTLETGIAEILELEHPIDGVLAEFKASREKDRITGRNHFGAQRADIKTIFKGKNIPATHCSTGEQKALLISIILAQQISSINKPILLLDEVFVHLDENRRKALGEFLVYNSAQTFVTTTEEETANYLEDSIVTSLEA
jgi:DNA replication and repair protein RecF